MSLQKKVLYIEDEPYLARIVCESLRREGYEVLHRTDGSRITSHIKTFQPHICVLDVMLPHTDGFSLGSHVRNLYPRLPILYLTARTQTQDLVQGFASGGTDYMKKPFSLEELVARIENQLRLTAEAEAPELPDEVKLGHMRFYPGRLELHGPGRLTRLSHREAQILSLLCSHQNRLLDRRSLLQAVWGDDSFFNSRNLDVYIRKLRHYFSEEPGIAIITLKGQGYQFVVS